MAVDVASAPPLTQQEQAALRAFLRRLCDNWAQILEEITLFGSKARGDSGPDSDIDVLIIVEEENWTLRDAISRIAAQVSLEYDVLINPHVIGRERWQRMGQERFSLYENVLREGVPLTPRSDP